VDRLRSLRRYRRLRAAVRWLKVARRTAFERMGSDRYSRPALDGLDTRLAEYLPHTGGVFVEAGAYDGYTQSNTYWFERFRGWSGVLVEPLPEAAQRARRNRPRSQVFQCALIPTGAPADPVVIRNGGTMSVTAGPDGLDAADAAHVARGAAQAGEDMEEVTVPTRTLSDVLREAAVKSIDLLSLDVEGREVSVLQGLELDEHHPRFILVEMLDEDAQRPEIEAVLGDRYEYVDRLSVRDFLYRLTPPPGPAPAS
jgi:FkbM family methyltransferase